MSSKTRIANEAWEALFRAQATIARELTAGDVWGDLRPRDYGVLYALSTAPDGLRITELGEDVLLTQPGMSRMIARLEARGLVERADDPDDARACRIRLTPAGVASAAARRRRPRAPRRCGDDARAQPRTARAAARPVPRTRSRPAMTDPTATLIVVSAGVSDPSSTRLLADRITQKSLDQLREIGTPAAARVIELAPLAVEIARATVSGLPGEQLQTAIEKLAAADGLIAAAPVYKAGISGLFKSFVDLLDDDLLVAKPVLLAATAGSSRHALVIDEQMRPLFAYLRALTLPTSVFAAPDDWAATELGGRVERAATELAVLLQAGVGQRIADRAWSGYQHQFAGNATRAESTTADVDFNSPLMRLAAGGTARQPTASDDSPTTLETIPGT